MKRVILSVLAVFAITAVTGLAQAKLPDASKMNMLNPEPEGGKRPVKDSATEENKPVLEAVVAESGCGPCDESRRHRLNLECQMDVDCIRAGGKAGRPAGSKGSNPIE